ncbi:MAG TPA: transglutaminase-like domain-containing protein [Mobilitalea sp.]|nr:transglutaminase-like domain-containing protein [Mobilitalea sp.]
MVISMFKDREKLYQMYHTILSMALTWALTLAINQYYVLRVNIAVCALFSLIPACFIYLFDLNKKNIISYLLLLSIIPILALFFWIRRVNPIHWIKDLLHWCSIYDGSKELYAAYHAHFLALGIAIVSAILFYLLVKHPSAKIALAIVILAAMIILCISKISINKAVVGICIFYILSILVEFYGYIYSRRAGQQEKKAGILYLAPVCLLLAVLAISLPSKPDPIQWNGVKTAYQNLKNRWEIWMTDFKYYFDKNHGEFTVTFTGYDENSGELGNGSLTQNQKVALRVSGSERSNPVYLIGSVNDVYTGDRWEKSRTDYKTNVNEYLLDYTELELALSRQNKDILENNQFVDRRSMKVEYNNIKTKTFFYPIKSNWFNMLAGKGSPVADSSNITFDNAHGDGTTYEFSFYEMNLDGDAFQQMLRDAGAFSYNDFSDYSNDQKELLEWLDQYVFQNDRVDQLFNKSDMNTLLKERAASIKAEYTKLPDTLPDRVKELANKLTENYDNDYDKLKAIETFLKEYTYNTNPGQLPKGEDFVDYFLFDNKQGYCTSFASAMAVLGRCAGIPTRYVEGFVVTFDNKDRNGMCPVKNSQAHAWAEAYIEGIGWIPFEATPPFFDKRYVKWKELQAPQATKSSGFGNGYDQQHIQEFMQANQGKVPDVQKKNNSADIIAGIVIFLSVILILIITLVVYYFILNYQYKKSFKRSDYSRKMYLLFLRILNLLKREGFILEKQETILMLADRVRDHFHYDTVTFHDVADIFMHNRYGEEAVTKEEYEKADVFHRGLDNKRREELGRSRILFEEFRFLAKKSNR